MLMRLPINRQSIWAYLNLTLWLVAVLTAIVVLATSIASAGFDSPRSGEVARWQPSPSAAVAGWRSPGLVSKELSNEDFIQGIQRGRR